MASADISTRSDRIPSSCHDHTEDFEDFDIPDRSSDWRKCALPIWELFGIELHEECCTPTKKGLHIKEFTALMENAARSCGIPVVEQKGADMVFSKLPDIIMPLKHTLSWHDMTAEQREALGILCRDNLIDEKVGHGRKRAWYLIYRMVERLFDITDSAAGRTMRKDLKARSESEVVNPKSDYGSLALNFLETFFPNQVKTKHQQCAHLTTWDRNTEGKMVSCEPDILCGSSVRLCGRLLVGLLSLVVEVKREDAVHNQGPESSTLQSCWATLKQHFSQLLICMRDSLFSRKWNEFNNTTPENLLMFGAMIHGTKFQLTCLEVSRAHLSQIHRREAKLVRFDKTVSHDPGVAGEDNQPETSTEKQSNETISRDRGAKEIKTSVSSQGRSRCAAPQDPEMKQGVLYISRPVQLDNMFNMLTEDHSDFWDLVRFLETLQFCSYYDDVQKNKRFTVF